MIEAQIDQALLPGLITGISYNALRDLNPATCSAAVEEDGTRYQEFHFDRFDETADESVILHARRFYKPGETLDGIRLYLPKDDRFHLEASIIDPTFFHGLIRGGVRMGDHVQIPAGSHIIQFDVKTRHQEGNYEAQTISKCRVLNAALFLQKAIAFFSSARRLTDTSAGYSLDYMFSQWNSDSLNFQQYVANRYEKYICKERYDLTLSDRGACSHTTWSYLLLRESFPFFHVIEEIIQDDRIRSIWVVSSSIPKNENT